MVNLHFNKGIKILCGILSILMVIYPVSAAAIDLTVTPSTIDFGTVLADGSQITVSGVIKAKSPRNIDLYVWAEGPFQNGTNKISLDPNFEYSINGSTYSVLGIDNTIKWVTNWYKPSQGGPDILDESYKLKVPTGTPSGNYTTTIYHVAVETGDPGPISTLTQESQSNLQNTHVTNSSNDTANNTNNITVYTNSNDSLLSKGNFLNALYVLINFL
jgi:hypothetical protein